MWAEAERPARGQGHARWPAPLLLTGVALVLLAGCGTAGSRAVVADSGGGEVTGAPPASRDDTAPTTQTPTTHSNDPPGVGLDPCGLLDPTERSRAGLTSPGEPTTVAGSQACDYLQPGAFGVTVTLDEQADLETIRERASTAQEVRIGSSPALRVADEVADDGTCSVLLPAGEPGASAGVRSVHIDVTLADFHDTAQACSHATTVAESIEPELT